MYLFRLLTILFILSTLLLSTTLENASSKRIDKWHVLKYFSKGTIKNIYDKRKKSRVIKFDGNGTRTVYILKPKKRSFKRKKVENTLQWEMNYREDFVIMVGMSTLKGNRYIIYTPGDKDSYLQYGLGDGSTSGKWKKYSRNLQEDLENSDRYNKIISVNSFVIKGSGMVDNIKIIKSNLTTIKDRTKKDNIVKIEKKEDILKIEKKEKKNFIVESNITEKIEKNSNIHQPPIIYINGDNPLVLKKGERYVEQGAIAKTKDGSVVEVTVSSDIDIFRAGEYSVIYMAKNSNGDTTVDRRVVRVGNVEESQKKSNYSVSNRNESEINNRGNSHIEEVEGDDIDLEQRALEILEWEKQLAQREEELERGGGVGRNSSLKPNYPAHPGL